MGWESLVEASEKENEYFPSDQFESKSGIHDLIEAYDEEIFWDELSERMAERDVYDTLTEEQRKRLSNEAYVKLAAGEKMIEYAENL